MRARETTPCRTERTFQTRSVVSRIAFFSAGASGFGKAARSRLGATTMRFEDREPSGAEVGRVTASHATTAPLSDEVDDAAVKRVMESSKGVG